MRRFTIAILPILHNKLCNFLVTFEVAALSKNVIAEPLGLEKDEVLLEKESHL